MRDLLNLRTTGKLLCLALGMGPIVLAFADPAVVETLYEFSVPEGSNPFSPPVLGSDGHYYGTSRHGGAQGCGAVYRLTSGGEIHPVVAFDCLKAAAPDAALVEAASGDFFGTGNAGGTDDAGTVFRLTKQGTLTRLHSFSGPDGALPTGPLILAADGSLYGTTGNGGQAGLGTLYRIDAGGQFSVLHHFTADDGGGRPLHGLVALSDGSLIGSTTGESGTLFRLSNAGFESLLTLEEGQPSTDLVIGADGRVYGGISLNGSSAGAVFAYAVDTRQYSQLTTAGELEDIRDLLALPEGGFLAVSPERLSRISAAGAVTTIQAFTGEDGFEPRIGSDGAGNALVSNASNTVDGLGSLWKFTAPGDLHLIHSFRPPAGYLPQALTIAPDARLYGVTQGKAGGQTLFTMVAGGSPTVLHRFSESSGTDPNPLTLGTDGALWGTARSGGDFGQGSFFRFDPTASLQVVHHFSTGSPGELTRRGDGSFFSLVGPNAVRIDPDGRLTTVGRFDGSTSLGTEPQGPIHRTAAGLYYGLTSSGGENNRGTLFRLSATSAQTVFSFPDDPLGIVPVGGIASNAQGDLLFALSSRAGLGKLDSALAYQTIPGSDDPQTPLALGSDGHFYGVSRYDGANLSGSYFRLAADGTRTVLADFSADAITDALRLVAGPDGAFYGAARFGGASDIGSVLRFLGPAQAPGNLTASRTSSSSATLSWSAGLQASSYRLYVSQTSGQPGNEAAQSGITGTEAAVDNLVPGQAYYFTVVSVNAISESPASAEAALPASNAQLQLTATPGEIDPGQSSTLEWSSSDTSSCTASDAWSGSRPLNGTETVSPDDAGIARYTLSCTDGSATVTATAEVLVHAVYALEASVPALGFGDQPVGSASPNRGLQLNNTGNAPLTITGLSVGGDHPADFSLVVDGCSNRRLQAGDACALSFAFRPEASGDRTAVERIVTDQSGVVAEFGLSGRGTQAVATLTPSSFGFGEVAVGARSASQSFDLVNSGNSAMTIQLVSLPSGFVQTNDCPASLAAKARCQIAVRFAPAGAASYTGVLKVTTSAANSPSTATLTGVGVAPAEHPSATAADPNGQPVTLELLSPSGGAIDSFSAATRPSFAPTGYDYLGFYSFSLSGLTAGASVTVRLTLPTGSVFDSYIKCSSSACAPYPSVSISGNQLSLMLTDGGAGDSDGVVNGRISDPGSPARTVPAPLEGEGGGGLSPQLLAGLLLTAIALRRRLSRS